MEGDMDGNMEKGELIPMRPDERIDPERVGEFLEGRLEGARGIPRISQFSGGKANLTYLLSYPGREYVLRRPPLGPVAPKSHDMGREYRVLSSLHPSYPLAPRAYLLCDDPSVAGAQFLVLERRDGIVIREEMPPELLGRPELYRRMSEAMVDAMADLHGIDPAAVGLMGLGRPEGFLARQVEGWYRRWLAAGPEEGLQMERLWGWLGDNLPKSGSVSLVHNDFKLDNMMLEAGNPARIVAVFDWDMCTVGDPLVDLGVLLGYWVEPTDQARRAAFRTMPTHLPGFFTRKEVVARYARRSGREPAHIRYYEIFALFKLAVIVQQIHVRWLRGQTRDNRFADYGGRVKSLIQAAWESTAQYPKI